MCMCVGDSFKGNCIKKIKKGKFIRKEKKIVIKSDSLLPVIEANIRTQIGKFRLLVETNKIDRNNMKSMAKGIYRLQQKLVESVYVALLEIEINEKSLVA
jgi:hypothetical protein